MKSFGPVSFIRQMRTRRRGSKAKRSWLAAEYLNSRGVGTPDPVAYLERWERGRLKDSYFIAAYIDDAETLRDALARLFDEQPECEKFLDLLEQVAQSVRTMHDAGFVHRDLGNTNILLERDGPGRWRDLRIVDLNRGEIGATVGLRERARDLSRLALPSHLRRLFMRMYWNSLPPEGMARWASIYVRLHRWWVQSRRLRHPIREGRLRSAALSQGVKARTPRDLWIWDERTGQPLAPMLRSDRVSHYPASRSVRMVADTLRAAPSVWREYRPLLDQAFQQPVDIAGRIGVAVDASNVDPDRELELLAGLGRVPTFVRFCHHESRERRRGRMALVRSLHRASHPVAIGLVQDRRAVNQPAAWHNFVNEVLDEVGSFVELVEIGHSINRTKWGVWDFDELASLYAPLEALHKRCPSVRFMGPAVIDFEYPFVLSALRQWPGAVPLAALSQHLYLDRRGAPETPQRGFGALEKFALARAIARASPHCEDRLIVSEVNWPLAGTAPHCPVSAPYVVPGHDSGKAAVSEDNYGDYMLRYLCLALASGLVDRVYWWRLVARGFGLVDDTDPARLRLRPAYRMLATYLGILGESTFIKASVPMPNGVREGSFRLTFQRPDGEIVVLAYAHGAPQPLSPGEAFRPCRGLSLATSSRPCQRTSAARPIYLRNASAENGANLSPDHQRGSGPGAYQSPRSVQKRL